MVLSMEQRTVQSVIRSGTETKFPIATGVKVSEVPLFSTMVDACGVANVTKVAQVSVGSTLGEYSFGQHAHVMCDNIHYLGSLVRSVSNTRPPRSSVSRERCFSQLPCQIAARLSDVWTGATTNDLQK